MKSTIDHVSEELSWNGLLHRYKTDETDDGLKGSEGAVPAAILAVIADQLLAGIEEFFA